MELRSILAPDSETISVNQAIENIGFGKFQIALIAVCGLLQAVDAIEMLLLSVLGPAVACQWKISDQQIAFITTGVFLGMLIGAPLWGLLADRKGRWATLLLTSIFITYFGLLSAFSYTYIWLVVLRGLVGFGIGGVMAAATSLFSEFMPSNARAKAMTALLCCWSFGSLGMAGLSYLILPTLGWRWLAGLAAVPLFISTFTFIWLPRSPRFLLISGNAEKSLEVLNYVAKMNGKPQITARLKESKAKGGQVKDFFHRKYILGTFLQWFIWFGSGFVYYGIVLIATELPRVSRNCLQNWSAKSIVYGIEADSSCCPALSDDTYIAIIISTIGEFASLPLTAILLDLWGRKLTMAFSSTCGAIMFFFLNFCLSKVGNDIFLLLTRMFCLSIFNCAYVYTNEYYPTSVRVLGMGTCSGLARVGAMVTPYVAQVLLPHYSVLDATLVYAAVMLVMAICAIVLPIETKGRPLRQTVDDVSEGDDAVKNEPATYDTFKDKGE